MRAVIKGALFVLGILGVTPGAWACPAGSVCEQFPAYTNAAPSVTAPAPTDRIPYVQGATTKFVSQLVSCPTVETFGGSGNGSTDNAPAMSRAIAAAVNGQVCVSMGRGTYLFNSATGYSIPIGGSFTVVGTGIGQTNLLFPTNDGFDLSFPAGSAKFNASDMSVLTGSAGGHIAFNLNGAGFSPASVVNLDKVEFRGADGYGQTDYWSTAVMSHLVSNVTLTNTVGWGSSSSQGTIASVAGDQPTTTFAIVYNFINPNYNNCAVGIQYGGYAQGVNVIGGNFVNCLKGIYVPPGGTGNAQLTVTGAQFGLSTNDISIEDDVGTDILITNNFFVYNSTIGPMTGILLQDFINTCVISGNQFGWGNSPAADGIVATAVSFGPCNITGNSFYNLQNHAIWLKSTSGRVQVTNTNVYAGNAVNLLNEGGNTAADNSPYGGGIAFFGNALDIVAPVGGNINLQSETALSPSLSSGPSGSTFYAPDGSFQFNVFPTLSGADYLGVTAGTAGNGATMEVGSNVDVSASMNLVAKGSGNISFFSQSTLDGFAGGGGLHSSNGVSCGAGTVSLSTLTVVDGIVTHC
jgi:hypothetical protein